MSVTARSPWGITKTPGRKLAVVIAVLATLSGVIVLSPRSDVEPMAPQALEDLTPFNTSGRPDEVSASQPEQAMAIARSLGVPVEVISEREPSAEIFAQPDGTWVRREWMSPVWVQISGDGTSVNDWRQLDVTLERSPDGTFAPAAFHSDLSLSGGGEDAVVARWGVPDTDVVVSLVAPTASLPEPLVEGARARYRDIWPGIDFVVDVLSTGFEQYYVIKDPDALARIGTDLTIHYAIENGAIAQEGRNLAIVDAAGETVAQLPEPLAWDATNDAKLQTPILAPWAVEGENPAAGDGNELADFEPVAWGIDSQSGIAVVTLKPDAAWLMDPNTTYPIVIDPTIYRTYASFDAYITSSSPNSNYSTQSEMMLGKRPDNNGIYRSHTAFDVSTAKTLDIISATYVVWNWWAYNCSQTLWKGVWTSPPNSGHTWNSGPAWLGYYTYSDTTYGHTSGNGTLCAEGWASMDITPYALAWRNQTANTQGLIFMANDDTTYTQWKRFRTNESSSPNKPHIDYTYNRYPNTPTAVDYVAPSGSARGKLVATVSDADGGSVRARFTVERRPVGSTSEGDWAPMFEKAEGNSVTSGSTSYRELELIGGFEYRVKAWGFDGRVDSTTPSAWKTFTVTAGSGFQDIPTTADTGV